MEVHCKIVLVGEAGVGKSALLKRYIDNDFNEGYNTTIGVDFKFKTLLHQGENPVKLNIWDTAGQERFRSITISYYRGSQAVLIIFDLSDRKSFERVSYWLKQVKSNCTKLPLFFLVGNKSDIKYREVKEYEARQFAQSENMRYFETSAKTGQGLEELFEEVVDTILEREGKTGNIINTRSPLKIENTKISLYREKQSKKLNRCC